MMNRDMRREMLPKPVLEIAQHGRTDLYRLLLAPRAGKLTKLPSDHSFGRTNTGALPKNFFGEQTLLVVRLSCEQDLGVANRK